MVSPGIQFKQEEQFYTRDEKSREVAVSFIVSDYLPCTPSTLLVKFESKIEDENATKDSIELTADEVRQLQKFLQSYYPKRLDEQY